METQSILVNSRVMGAKPSKPNILKKLASLERNRNTVLQTKRNARAAVENAHTKHAIYIRNHTRKMLNTLTRSNKINLLQPANYFGEKSANNITNSNLDEAEKTYIEHKSGMFNIRMNKENTNFENAKREL